MWPYMCTIHTLTMNVESVRACIYMYIGWFYVLFLFGSLKVIWSYCTKGRTAWGVMGSPDLLCVCQVCREMYVVHVCVFSQRTVLVHTYT